MTSRNPITRGAMLSAAVAILAGCEAPADEELLQPPSDNEQAALEKAEAMIEENRDRLENEETSDDEAGSVE